MTQTSTALVLAWIAATALPSAASFADAPQGRARCRRCHRRGACGGDGFVMWAWVHVPGSSNSGAEDLGRFGGGSAGSPARRHRGMGQPASNRRLTMTHILAFYTAIAEARWTRAQTIDEKADSNCGAAAILPSAQTQRPAAITPQAFEFTSEFCSPTGSRTEPCALLRIRIFDAFLGTFARCVWTPAALRRLDFFQQIGMPVQYLEQFHER